MTLDGNVPRPRLLSYPGVDFVRHALKEVVRVAKPGSLLYITPVDVPRAELEGLLAPVPQVRIRDLSRVSDEEEAHSRLVLAK